TKWGLFRHYWVLISLLLAIIATVVLLVETQTISYFADIAADPGDFVVRDSYKRGWVGESYS
ncbi:MAG: hypothetical protein M3305_16255, partial [Actinomycetota bacterium]|nr:hypothetical protein [Actinomycetota bacterium]